VRAIRFAEQPLPPGYRWEIGGDRKPLVDAIRQALARAGIRRRLAIMALPRRQVTARISPYPAADRASLRRVIEYDLADQIPFPVEQVVLDFQPLGPSREQAGLTDVLVVAAQRDLVREYLAVAKDLGMRLAALTVDALALHDLVRLTADKRPGVTLAIETGARASTINASEGGRLRLTRSVGFGGQPLALAIRDDLGVSLEEAQRLKETEGLGLLERHPQPHRVAAWAENLRGELRRSALSFGPAVTSLVLLVGAGSEIPGFAEAIRSEFGLEPVRLSVRELFPAATLRGEASSADRCLLAIAQALRGSSRTAWTISLVPREVAEVRRGRALRIASKVAAVVAIAALAVGYVVESRTLGRQKGKATQLQRQARTAELQQAQARKVLDERDAIRKDLQLLQLAEARRYAALELLRTISESASPGVLITHFTLRPGQPLQVQGNAPDSGAVADLQAGIARSRLVTAVSLDRADQVAVTRPVPYAGPAASEVDAGQRNRSPAKRSTRTSPRAKPAQPPPAAMRPVTTSAVSFTLTVHLWIEPQTGRQRMVSGGAAQ
jgi:type IV pilus assembly protein PilM